MSTPQVIMLAHMSLKHIHQRLANFLRFVQLSGITSRKLCTTLIRRLVLSLRFLLSRWQILCQCEKQRTSFSSLDLTKRKIDEESGSSINSDEQSQVSCGLNDYRVDAYFAAHYSSFEQIVIPLNNVACSLCPSIIEPRNDSSSSSSQTLDTILHSPEMLSPSDDRTTPSLRISVSDDSNTPMYTSHLVTSPTADPRRLHHRQRGYSTESTDKLGSGDFSRLSRASRDMTLVAEGSQLSIDLSTGISHEGTMVSSPTCMKDQGTPILSFGDIYPVAPENFPRYEKTRRKM